MRALEIIAYVLASLAVLVPAGLGAMSWLRTKLGRLSWRAIERGVARLYDQMATDGYVPEVIICLGRSGSIVGAMLSGCFETMVPIVTVSFEYGHHSRHPLRGREHTRSEKMIDYCSVQSNTQEALLLGVDIITGGTMEVALRELERKGVRPTAIACLFWNPDARTRPGYHHKEISARPRYPWMRTRSWRSWSAAPGRQAGRAAGESTPQSRTVLPVGLRLYLVRHARTTAGDSVFCGTTNHELSPEGAAQANQLALRFHNRPIRDIYCSPLLRAEQTAQILRNALPNAEINTRASLREMDYGDWEGLSHEQVQDRDSSVYESWAANPTKTIPRNSESPESVLERLQGFLSELKDSHHQDRPEEVIAVLHKGTIRILLAYLLGETLRDYRKRDISYGAVIEVFFDGADWAVYDPPTSLPS